MWFIAGQVSEVWDQLGSYELRIEPLPFVMSYLWLFLANILLVLCYQVQLRSFGVGLTFPRCFQIWLMAMPLKYIPGKLGIIAGRIVLHGQVGIGKGLAVAAYLLEGFYILFTGLAVGVFCLAFFNDELRTVGLGLGTLLLLGGFAFLHPRVSPWFLRRGLERFGEHGYIPPMKLSSVFTIYGYYVAIWVVKGLSTYALANSLFPQEPISVPQGISTFALSLLGGSLTVLPGGLGIQEAVGMNLLTNIYTIPEAPLVVSAAFRLHMISGEVAFALLAALWWAVQNGGWQGLLTQFRKVRETEHSMHVVQEEQEADRS